jgi:hypothetical protein
MKRQVSVIVDADGHVVGTQIAPDQPEGSGSIHARLVSGPGQEPGMYSKWLFFGLRSCWIIRSPPFRRGPFQRCDLPFCYPEYTPEVG